MQPAGTPAVFSIHLFVVVFAASTTGAKRQEKPRVAVIDIRSRTTRPVEKQKAAPRRVAAGVKHFDSAGFEAPHRGASNAVS